jgi:hypothetical protein
MLDTIKLKLTGVNNFQIGRPENFNPEFKPRSYQDLSATERKSRTGRPCLRKFHLHNNILVDEYQPRAEIYESVDFERCEIKYTLAVEFSSPKLILENNLIEISENDGNRMAETLRYKLMQCGISVKDGALPCSMVGKVHFAKNIILPDDVLMTNILSELSRASLSASYDITKTKHKNDSEALQFFCGSRDYAFYDKIKDIQKPKNKSTDKDKTSYEEELVRIYGLDAKSVFRYEYRLNKPAAIKSEINAFYGRFYNEAVIFRDLFDEKLWKTLIVKSWEQIIQRPGNQLALKFSSEGVDIFKHMLMAAKNNKNNGHSINSSLTSFGLAALAKECGVSAVRHEFRKIWSERSCGERFDKKIEEAAKLLVASPYSDDIVYIDEKLREFRRITDESLKNDTIKKYE